MDQLFCAQRHMGQQLRIMSSGPTSPSLISLIIFRKTPNTAVVASEYDLTNYGFFQRN